MHQCSSSILLTGKLAETCRLWSDHHCTWKTWLELWTYFSSNIEAVASWKNTTSSSTHVWGVAMSKEEEAELKNFCFRPFYLIDCPISSLSASWRLPGNMSLRVNQTMRNFWKRSVSELFGILVLLVVCVIVTEGFLSLFEAFTLPRPTIKWWQRWFRMGMTSPGHKVFLTGRGPTSSPWVRNVNFQQWKTSNLRWDGHTNCIKLL